MTNNTTPWPFKYVNGQQTQESEALQRSVEADKGQHKASEFDLNQCEDALL
jgi:hypothetical protein